MKYLVPAFLALVCLTPLARAQSCFSGGCYAQPVVAAQFIQPQYIQPVLGVQAFAAPALDYAAPVVQSFSGGYGYSQAFTAGYGVRALGLGVGHGYGYGGVQAFGVNNVVVRQRFLGLHGGFAGQAFVGRQGFFGGRQAFIGRQGIAVRGRGFGLGVRAPAVIIRRR